MPEDGCLPFLQLICQRTRRACGQSNINIFFQPPPGPVRDGTTNVVITCQAGSDDRQFLIFKHSQLFRNQYPVSVFHSAFSSGNNNPLLLQWEHQS
jgi:hypothetical protein